MQLTLPAGFDSWAQVLTDWRVIRAFDASPFPRCFTADPELAAPFVAAISRAIYERQLRRAPSELMFLRECVVEPAYDRAGGPTYLTLRDSMETAQERHIIEVYVLRHERNSLSFAAPPAEVHRLQSAFFAFRERYLSDIEQAQRVVAHDYWEKHPRRGLNDGFFDDAIPDSVPARVARIDPAWWWRSFFSALQTACVKHHSADGRFLDALPMLRASATKKTLAALIAEWCESRADEWGWSGPGHYRMLAMRAGSKAETIREWYDLRAPGYRYDATVRRQLHGRLCNLLAKADPLTALYNDERPNHCEYWRN